MSAGLQAFTLIHVILSLVGIGSGFVVLGGLFAGRTIEGWTAAFLTTTIQTA